MGIGIATREAHSMSATDSRRAPRRIWLSRQIGWHFVWLYRLCPAMVDVVVIIRPEHTDPLASARIQGVLALEVAIPRWPPGDPQGNPRGDPGDEPGQLAVGRAADPYVDGPCSQGV
jgi:hypothetical protein